MQSAEYFIAAIGYRPYSGAWCLAEGITMADGPLPSSRTDSSASSEIRIANRIAEKSPIALRLAKEAIRLASRSNMDEGLRREVDLFALCFSSEDKDEGVKAFLEKRKADFKGK